MNKVTCPYCGAEMIAQRESTGMVRGMDFMVCHKCFSRSPAIYTVDGNWDGKQACAHAAAMQRWREPNRVLTLVELNQLAHDAPNDMVYIERKDAWSGGLEYVTCADDFRHYEPGGQGSASYGVTWRARLRRPTDEERAGAGWDLNHDGESENG